MKKTILATICLVLTLCVALSGCLAGKPPENASGTGTSAAQNVTEKQTSSSGGQVTIRFLTYCSGPELESEKQITNNFMKANPNIKVELTSIPGIQEFITALKAKFAAGEEPDVYEFQGGNRVREFAEAGLLYDITDEPFMDNAREEDLAFNTYNGKVYGFPLDYQATGLFINMDKFNEFNDLTIPDCFPSLIENCEKIRQQGMEYPMIMAGKDINNVSQFDFQYLSTVVLFNNPDYYKEMLEGTRKFNDPFIREMFDKFGKVKEYMSEDSLGVDNEEAIKRFVRGDGVFWIAHGSTVARIRELGGDEFNFAIIPSVLQDKPEDRVFNVGLCDSISIVKSTKNLDAAKAFVSHFISKESAELYVQVGKIISAVKGVDVVPDPAYEMCIEWFDQPRKSPHADLVWIPGIKDVMKEVTQKWFMGEPLDNVLDEWESQHQRLLKADPDFITRYNESEFVRNYGRH